jgi:hypothetical protein
VRAAASRLFPSDGGFPVALTAVLVIYAFFDCALLRLFGPGSDWGPLWAAGGLAWTDPLRAYDFSYVTSLQGPLLAPTSERPFVYPPTSLLFFAPFGLLPFRFSYALFVAASLFAFARQSSKIGAKPVLPWIAPPVVLAAIAGQPTLLVTALVIAALLDLPSSERRAGLILGIAAVLKPPLLLLAPFALIGGRNWRALESAGLTVASLTGASILLFGADAWQAWFAALPKFQELVAGFEPLLRNTVTPHATVLRLGYDPQWTTLGFALIAIPMVMLAFARTCDIPIRLVMLVGGALLITPYGMYYELATLAPVVATLPLRRARDALIPVVWATSLFVNASVVGLLVIYCWAAARLFLASRADDRMVQVRVDIPA